MNIASLPNHLQTQLLATRYRERRWNKGLFACLPWNASVTTRRTSTALLCRNYARKCKRECGTGEPSPRTNTTVL
jgi:hypothetical protein